MPIVLKSSGFLQFCGQSWRIPTSRYHLVRRRKTYRKFRRNDHRKLWRWNSCPQYSVRSNRSLRNLHLRSNESRRYWYHRDSTYCSARRLDRRTFFYWYFLILMLGELISNLSCMEIKFISYKFFLCTSKIVLKILIQKISFMLLIPANL